VETEAICGAGRKKTGGRGVKARLGLEREGKKGRASSQVGGEEVIHGGVLKRREKSAAKRFKEKGVDSKWSTN